MWWDCNITTMITGATASADKDQSGCCLRDLSTTEGGGYCLLYNDATPTIPTTYRLSEDNFASVTDDTSVNFTSEMLTAGDGFTGFDCASVDANGMLGCKKLQFWPAASWANGFRFEQGNEARGYIFDNQATEVPQKWLDEDQTLNGAMSKFMTASTAMIALSLSFYF